MPNSIWDWLRKTAPLADRGFVCPYDSATFQPGEVYFRCRNPQCHESDRGVPRAAGARTVFKPSAFGHSVACPRCKWETSLKVCPKCWRQLPLGPGQRDMLTIAGLPQSGKTCYMLSLMGPVQRELNRLDTFRMTLSPEDDVGRDYFVKMWKDLAETGDPPGPTMKSFSEEAAVQTPAIVVTVRCPRWQHGRRDDGKMAVAPLVFHDPAGEWFRRFEDVHEVNFLRHTRSLILLVDPLTFPDFTPLKRQPRPEAVEDPATALITIAQKLRHQHPSLNGERKIPMDLAVVITKSDCGVFGESSVLDELPPQTAPYDPALTEKISGLCMARLQELGVPRVVAEAENNFQNVCYFAVSALGNSLTAEGKIDVSRLRPRRVEDPFLWILHQWGLL